MTTNPTSIATLQRLPPSALATLLRSPTTRPRITVIDVRDSDYIGGHIRGCLNVPTSTHDHAMPELARKLAGQDMVVFHCALSQQRGPSSALRYLRERERLRPTAAASSRGQEGEVDGGQKVVLLEGGFSRWQELYGEDEELTEGYQKDIWAFGY